MEGARRVCKPSTEMPKQTLGAIAGGGTSRKTTDSKSRKPARDGKWCLDMEKKSNPQKGDSGVVKTECKRRPRGGWNRKKAEKKERRGGVTQGTKVKGADATEKK